MENDFLNLLKFNTNNDDYQAGEQSLNLNDSSELMSSSTDNRLGDPILGVADMWNESDFTDTDFFSPEGKKLLNEIGFNIEDDQFSPSTTAVPTPFSEESYINNISEVDNHNSNDSMKMVTSAPFVSMSQIHGTPMTRNNNIVNRGLSTPQGHETFRRNARKSSLTPRQVAASPTLPYQFGNEDDDNSNGSSILDVKPDIDLLQMTAWIPGQANKRPASKISSTNGKKTGGKGGQDSSKKPKMYEQDDPKARNAKLAYQNREKKKQEREHLIKENDLLSKRIRQQTDESEKLAKRVKALESQLEAAQRKNRAEGGLQRVFSSAKDILETIMPPLITKYGQFNCKAAPWFKNVAIPLDDSLCDAILAKCSSPTSTYITFNISTAERMVHIDYDPNIPDFAKKTDGTKQL